MDAEWQAFFDALPIKCRDRAIERPQGYEIGTVRVIRQGEVYRWWVSAGLHNDNGAILKRAVKEVAVALWLEGFLPTEVMQEWLLRWHGELR